MRPMRIKVDEATLEARHGYWVWRTDGQPDSLATDHVGELANLLQEARQIIWDFQDATLEWQRTEKVDRFLEKTSVPEPIMPETPKVEDVLVRRCNDLDQRLREVERKVSR